MSWDHCLDKTKHRKLQIAARPHRPCRKPLDESGALCGERYLCSRCSEYKRHAELCAWALRELDERVAFIAGLNHRRPPEQSPDRSLRSPGS